MKDKAVTVGRKHKRDVERQRVIERLLYSVTNAMVVVLGLDDGDADIGLVYRAR